jgi:hypothetical protein
MKIILTTLILVAFCFAEVQAAQIQNLSNTPQTIELMDRNDAIITLAPGGIWQGLGRAHVKWREREVDIEYNEEYVIWDNDTFGPQRRLGSRTDRNL